MAKARSIAANIKAQKDAEYKLKAEAAAKIEADVRAARSRPSVALSIDLGNARFFAEMAISHPDPAERARGAKLAEEYHAAHLRQHPTLTVDPAADAAAGHKQVAERQRIAAAQGKTRPRDVEAEVMSVDLAAAKFRIERAEAATDLGERRRLLKLAGEAEQDHARRFPELERPQYGGGGAGSGRSGSTARYNPDWETNWDPDWQKNSTPTVVIAGLTAPAAQSSGGGWDSSKHPRVPKGSGDPSGEFTNKK